MNYISELWIKARAFDMIQQSIENHGGKKTSAYASVGTSAVYHVMTAKKKIAKAVKA